MSARCDGCKKPTCDGCKLRETRPFVTHLVEVKLEEGKSLPPGCIMQASAKFAHASKITENGRMYRRSWYERQIARVNREGGELQEKAMIGETDHPGPTSDGPRVRQSAFVVTGLGMNEAGEVLGKIDIADTGAGQDMAALVRLGAQVGFSSRARGDTAVKKMTSADPDFEQNRGWDGKEFGEVDDQSELVTYDCVIGPAVADANVGDYHEQSKEVEVMKVEDILKNEELMKGIAESDAVKKLVEKAVVAAVKVNTEEMDKKFAEELKPMVQAHMESDGFMDKFEIVAEGEEDLVEAQCADCKAGVRKGDKFCPGCGIPVSKAVPAAKKEGAEGADNQMDELTKRLDQLEKEKKEQAEKIASFEKKDEDRDEADAVEAIVFAELEGKPAVVAENVRADIKELTERGSPLTSEGAKEFVEAKVVKYVPFAKTLEEAGRAKHVKPGDEDEVKLEEQKETKEVHDQLDQVD